MVFFAASWILAPGSTLTSNHVVVFSLAWGIAVGKINVCYLFKFFKSFAIGFNHSSSCNTSLIPLFSTIYYFTHGPIILTLLLKT
jgi:hypothetical protein